MLISRRELFYEFIKIGNLFSVGVFFLLCSCASYKINLNARNFLSFETIKATKRTGGMF